MNEPLPPADEDYGEVSNQYPENDAYGYDDESPDETISETVKVGNSNLPKSYDVALAMQRILQGQIADSATSASDRARLVVAWDKLEDRKRILRGKPLPGSLSHTGTVARRKANRVSPISVLPSANVA